MGCSLGKIVEVREKEFCQFSRTSEFYYIYDSQSRRNRIIGIVRGTRM